MMTHLSHVSSAATPLAQEANAESAARWTITTTVATSCDSIDDDERLHGCTTIDHDHGSEKMKTATPWVVRTVGQSV
ncbi:hypothetical protein SCLCIDRAFT_1210952, partial [Scleroderma citrinum Foug A]